MYSRIVLITRSGDTRYGDVYRVDTVSPIPFPDYDREISLQTFVELEKARTKHQLLLSDIERWYVKNL